MEFVKEQFFNLDFKKLMDSTKNLVAIIDAEGNFKYANSSYIRETGYDINEFMELNFRNLLIFDFEKKFNYVLNNELNNSNSWKMEIEHRRKDGSVYWTTSYFTKLKDEENNILQGYLLIEDDISSIKLLTTQLEMKANLLFEEKMKIEAIFNDIPFGILVLDDKNIITYINENFNSLFKNEFNRTLTINSNIDNYLPNEIIQEILNLSEKEENKEFIFDLPSNKHLQINTLLLKKVNEESLFIVIARDISKVVEFNLIQRQFVTSISHELRTPIASILLSVNNFLSFEERLNKDQKGNLLNIIKQNATILAHIVEDLLIVSNIDNKKLILRNWTKISVDKLIKEVIFQLNPQIDSKKLNVILNCENDYELFTDIDRFKQIIRIPLDNAIKYSNSRNDIIIEVQNSYKGKLNPNNDKGFLITITDFGIGIKESDLKYMFKRYYRAKNTQNIQGTGIGLSILKELVILVKGNVEIKSKENIQTDVCIFLPLIENSPS